MKTNMISDQMFQVLKKITQKYPSVIVGGSIALKVQGLLKRDCGDIDLFIDENEILEGFGELVDKDSKSVVFSDINTDIHGRVIEREGHVIDSVKVCLFKVPKDILESFRFELKYSDETLKLNLHKIEHILRAKEVYGKKVQKHSDDLKEILPLLKSRSGNIY